MSVCCVGSASLDVASDEIHDGTRNPGLEQLLISVCMFIVSKALFISSATVIVRAGVNHLVEPICNGVI